MFERYTEAARQVVVKAQEEARTLGHNWIGTEHVLLGLLFEQDQIAGRVLRSAGVTSERVREQLVTTVGRGEEATEGWIPFTPRAKKVMELGLREALSLGHNNVGTEHLLLGLLRESEGVAMRILLDLDVKPAELREAVIAMAPGPVIAMAPGPASRSTRRSDRARAAREAQTEALVPAGFRVEHGSDVVRLLLTATARALDDGRTETTLEDVLVALTRDQRTAPLWAELGLDEAAIRVALARRAQPEEPPAADAES